MNTPIEHVSDTAFWIADLRRLESERSDALFRDPFAGKLAGERGRKISAGMRTSGIVAWTVAIRTVIIDEFLQFAIDSGVDTVLNLGAGLDARPYRMKLPETLQWIEADYGHMLEYKESQLQGLQPSCKVEQVKIDLADREARLELFTRVNAQTRGGIVVLTEGVVPYLANDAVASLADDLRAMGRVRFWILDYFSKETLKYRQRGGVGRAMRNAPFQFDPPDWFEFFKQHRWRTRELRYLADEAKRFKRPFPMPLQYRVLAALMRPLVSAERRAAMQKFAGYAMLEPTD